MEYLISSYKKELEDIFGYILKRKIIVDICKISDGVNRYDCEIHVKGEYAEKTENFLILFSYLPQYSVFLSKNSIYISFEYSGDHIHSMKTFIKNELKKVYEKLDSLYEGFISSSSKYRIRIWHEKCRSYNMILYAMLNLFKMKLQGVIISKYIIIVDDMYMEDFLSKIPLKFIDKDYINNNMILLVR